MFSKALAMRATGRSEAIKHQGIRGQALESKCDSLFAEAFVSLTPKKSRRTHKEKASSIQGIKCRFEGMFRSARKRKRFVFHFGFGRKHGKIKKHK